MTDPTRTISVPERPVDLPRLRRRVGAITGVLCLAGLLTTFSLDLNTAAAAGRHTAHRTAVRKVHASVSRSATVTAHASEHGRTVAATATAHATGKATAKATGRASATATRTSLAQARALQRAAARAEARAGAAATARAARRAQALATTMARAQATTQAERAVEKLATGHGGTSTNSGTGGSSAGTAPACGGESVLKSNGSPWTCTFDDEFGGTGLDTAKWVVQTTANSGFAPGGGCYLNDRSNISVSGGTLNLTARKQSAPISCPSPKGAFSTSYTAGEVTTMGTFSQTYGRFEVRAQLPATAVAGLQETFWLWPNTQSVYGPWPASGEIDFAEFYSQYASWVIPYLHYDYDPSTASWATNTNIVTAWPYPYNQPGMNCSIAQAGFNTYTLTWLPGQLTIAVNGQNCIVDNYRATGLSGPAPFDQPFFLALTQALGTGSNAPTANTPLPATTHVDYVRVWK